MININVPEADIPDLQALLTRAVLDSSLHGDRGREAALALLVELTTARARASTPKALTPSQVAQARSLPNRIHAVKYIREVTKCSLREAVDMVNGYGMSWPSSDLYMHEKEQ